MACYRPIDVWRAAPPGKGILFTTRGAWIDKGRTQIPCGQCIGCRLVRKDEWKTRIILEGKMHECASFVTLTYSQEHLPQDYSLSKRHAQTWLKRLRWMLGDTRIRYFLCGEYGGEKLRPHYHAIIFGFDFPDRTPWRRTPSGEVSYRSELLEKTWNLGHAEVGTFTPASAGYVAGYSVKKVNGDEAPEHYSRLNPDTGEVHTVTPEFILMSSRPGIGKPWLDAYKVDTEESTFVIIDGARKPLPRYFKRHLEGRDLADRKLGRQRVSSRLAKEAARGNPDNHWRRRQDREEYATLIQERRKPGDLEE
ncbi:MAG: replication initiator protein [Microviridae sp.]|nr:MAG: replication initiator protein [Microviridae sp.]